MTHGNMGINGTAYRIIATRELLGFLSSKDDKRYSKMDAFIDLLDRTADGTQHTLRHDRTSEQLLKQQAVITITKLAEAWGWHRETVRNFLLALEKMNVIRLHQEAKFSIITFYLFSIGNDDQYSHPLTDDEVRLNRWISGYIAIEEMAGEFVQSVTEMETMLAELPTDKTHSTGIRLHKMVSHLILQNSNLIPCDSKVETALSDLFNRHCNQDLTRLLQMFTVAGLKLVSNMGLQHMEPMAGISSPEARRCLETIVEYYLPFLMKNRAPSTKEPYQDNP